MSPPETDALGAPLLTIVRGGDIYAPEHLGEKTVVLAGGRIVWVGTDASLPEPLRHVRGWSDEIDATGCLVVPGLLDPHQHTIGGGGEEGYASRMPEVCAEELFAAGITTSIGCLGTDVTTRHLTTLLAKTRQLEADGLSAYMLTGGFTVPPKTITGSVGDDVIVVDKVIGVGEVAISDRRACDPTLAELARVATQAYRGGCISGKAGRTLFHLGDGKRRLQVVGDLLDQHDVEPSSLVVDHVNRSSGHIQDAVQLARRGVHVCMDTVDGDLPRWLGAYRDNGGPADKLSVCSDAHTAGGDVAKLPQALSRSVREGFPLSEVLAAFTSNTADAWKLGHKGRIAPGQDADLVFLDAGSLCISHVIARGELHRPRAMNEVYSA